MSDIVERLNLHGARHAAIYNHTGICGEAAAEITRLRDEVERLREGVDEILRDALTDDRIDEINKISDYKYFGDYEMSEDQMGAVWDAIFSLPKLKRLRALSARAALDG